ncbi:acyl-CoA dehydratase activase [Megalodesulfovibrio gigas]|uniref:Putative coA-substrate-specific enzyme activase, putative domain protein n=1 Tax=Megalodesulfovibrio gigas (strain ATCC 19364 / DSM 1382 / NCIMB 9332 / VKM B-1759) TaxID=1121448 RepID=T2GB88_MEGG1|nr:acyl-CoA dehydratase activase [Megalodesulfovibrio gigas]AGW13162.1 putative coA-substrate-specific enzyme activase, putative domain protein [Megalodesulfovibrio gigas DSM 1382 = ATCC 19364]
MTPSLVAGIDIGSTATKCVILHAQDLSILATAIAPTGWSPREAGEAVLAEGLARVNGLREALGAVVVTGYGRKALPGLGKAMTEISCHARGAHFLQQQARLVLDIGGQDSKIIQLGPDGQVLDFVMNDKCAAGTGRFVANMAAALGMTLEELAAAGLAGTPVQLSSMCAVFAESEIIGSIARGAAPADLAAGIFQSIARRLKALLGRFAPGQPCVFTGGLACNAHIAALLSRHLEQPITPAPWPQHAGAVGAALFAATS